MFADVITTFRSWSFGELAIRLIIIAAIIAIILIALKAFKIPIPEWAIQICWVLGIAFVCILAIHLLMSMM